MRPLALLLLLGLAACAGDGGQDVQTHVNGRLDGFYGATSAGMSR